MEKDGLYWKELKNKEKEVLKKAMEEIEKVRDEQIKGNCEKVPCEPECQCEKSHEKD